MKIEDKKRMYELLIDYLDDEKNTLQVFNMEEPSTNDVIDVQMFDGKIQLIIKPVFQKSKKS